MAEEIKFLRQQKKKKKKRISLLEFYFVEAIQP